MQCRSLGRRAGAHQAGRHPGGGGGRWAVQRDEWGRRWPSWRPTPTSASASAPSNACSRNIASPGYWRRSRRSRKPRHRSCRPCQCLGWNLGTLWRLDREAACTCAQMLRKPSVEATQFKAATRASTFRPGSGLPGRVWASRAPACIPDVGHDPTFLRAGIAAREGLHAAFAFPILLGSEILASLIS